jgi:plastocyanin
VSPAAIVALLVTIAWGSCTSGTGAKLDIIALDYAFDPANTTLNASTIAITLHNQGDVEHDIEIVGTDQVLGHIDVVPPGLRRGTSVELDPGVYRLICTVEDHQQRGMVGTLTVR